ncbi:MAG: ribonuclease E inhibitor RraB [Pirellulales bacterium]|nr:ribonuclease E inhibitor RraB [Pirellulales bacterium]
MDFPDDANGDVLRRMEAAGMDLSRECEVEFWHVFDDEDDAEEMCRRLDELGYQAEMLMHEEGEEDEDDEEDLVGIDVLCTVTMVPTHAAITETEERLAKLAEACGGQADGWGVMQP